MAFQNYHEREDVKQEIRVEILKSYKSKSKYADWHNIVRGTINRRIIDYRKKLYKTPLLGLPGHHDNTDNFLTHIIENKLSEDCELFTDSIETSDLLENILSLYANCENEFDEWEQEYMEILYSCYLEHPNQPIELESKRMQLMGYEKGQRKEFRLRTKRFISKLNDLIQGSKL